MRPRLLILSIASASILAAEPEVDPNDLPRFPALSPAEALQSFVMREGFRVELAASEPNIGSPVAISFDEDGRMYVVEMRDYSEHRDEKLGRIRVLEDTDNNGSFEKSTIFAEGLAWPTAVICYDGGIFVGATPDILFLKDTNGDGKADERKVVFTGFGKGVERLNVQQLLNSFQWGIDNRIHGANGGNGGTIEQVASGAPTLRLGSRDFSFDPRTLVMRAETGGGQHGMSFDDFGRKFVSNNSSHIRMQAYEDRYLQGVEGIGLPAGMVDNIAREGPAAEVFRISPEEPWRTIRTKWRVDGKVPGPIEGGGRASGYFTGATGVTIYRGDAFPSEFRGNAFVGDAGGNLIHRKILEPNGVLFEAHRAPDELNREFLASRDTWFRPIQFANAPDGCLYVIDMYREVIEHPWSIPPNLKKLIDLDSGRERGRIWRIAPSDFKRRDRTNFKLLPLGLIPLLEHPNAWHRQTAARLLYQQGRAAASEIAGGQLGRMIIDSERPETRAQALWTLTGLHILERMHVLAGLADSNPGVVEAALQCANFAPHDGAASAEGLDQAFAKLADSTNARVRHQLAWTISETHPTNTTSLITKIVSKGVRDPHLRAACLVASRRDADAVFTSLWLAGHHSDNGIMDFLTSLAPQISTETIKKVSGYALDSSSLATRFHLASILAARDKGAVKPELELAANIANVGDSPSLRIAALQLLRLDDSENSRAAIRSGFEKPNADSVRIEAFRGLIKSPRDAAERLWTNWPNLSTQVRRDSLDLLLQQRDGSALLIDALKSARITRADLTASQTQALRQHSSPSISRPALELLGKLDSDRAAVLQKFRPALEHSGDPAAGEKIFIERCATCHRFAGKGFAVGPDLESVRGNGREYLLTHMLDPNREVNSRFVMYAAELRDGDTISGILARETDSEVSLRLANAEEKTVPRSQLKSLKASAQSFMPVGLEDALDEKAVAGLLDYLTKSP
ncbi:MAG TPA: PVC-type heme-binding CxxCH protein [Verrucomicrobiae bacterium]|nr:PVC-type heme-binding CxxCH protein [Verrucomicrobiae bacterium]